MFSGTFISQLHRCLRVRNVWREWEECKKLIKQKVAEARKKSKKIQRDKKNIWGCYKESADVEKEERIKMYLWERLKTTENEKLRKKWEKLGNTGVNTGAHREIPDHEKSLKAKKKQKEKGIQEKQTNKPKKTNQTKKSERTEDVQGI